MVSETAPAVEPVNTPAKQHAPPAEDTIVLGLGPAALGLGIAAGLAGAMTVGPLGAIGAAVVGAGVGKLVDYYAEHAPARRRRRGGTTPSNNGVAPR